MITKMYISILAHASNNYNSDLCKNWKKRIKLNIN